MNVKNEFAWISLYTSDDEDEIYGLEQIFYKNKIPCQIRQKQIASDNSYSLFTPVKTQELAKVVLENALIGNLDNGIIYESPPEKPEDKVVIDHSYEVRIPRKFFG